MPYFSRYSDWLRDGQPKGLSSSPGRVKNFFHVVQTGSGVHPTAYPMGTGGFFLGVKRSGLQADHSTAASAEVKKMWNYTSTPPYEFIVYCLIN
jgi:hypothetical protein